MLTLDGFEKEEGHSRLGNALLLFQFRRMQGQNSGKAAFNISGADDQRSEQFRDNMPNTWQLSMVSPEFLPAVVIET
jgi:hypothetical protein